MNGREGVLSPYAAWIVAENGEAGLNGDRLRWAESAWLAYALAQAGEAEQAAPILARMERALAAALLGGSDTDGDEGAGMESGTEFEAEEEAKAKVEAEVDEEPSAAAAYWLWAYGVSRSAGYAGPAASERLLAAAVSEVGAGFAKPRAHWLAEAGGPTDEAVWFANLAIAYGGLLAVQPHASGEGEAIQRWLKAIRELVFAKFIKDEKIVSRLGSSRIDGDIVLAAVPFGLLGIEDRILIEALDVLERELASSQGVRLSESDTYYGGCERPDLTALLAWYYAEKGDLARAKGLLAGLDRQQEASGGRLGAVDEATAREPLYAAHWRERGQPPASPFASLLDAIARGTLAFKQRGGAAGGGVRFLHEPTGTEDPYLFYVNERQPRHPLADELVRVRAVTQPFRPEQRTYAQYRAEGGAWQTVPMRIGRSPEGESYWEAALGRFALGERVEYRFGIEGEESASGTYAFRPRQWLPLGELAGWARLPQGVRLSFRPIPDATDGVDLVFDASAYDRALRLSVEAGQRSTRQHEGLSDNGVQSYDGLSDNSTPSLEGLSDRGVKSATRFGDWELRLSRSREGALDYEVAWRGDALLRSYGKHGQAAAELLYDGAGVRGIRCNFGLDDADRLYGMGERYARFEYRGVTVDNYVYNEYRSQGMRTYIPVPFVLHSRGYGLYANTPMYSAFDFGDTLADRMQIRVDVTASSPSLELILMPGEPLDAVRTYTDVTGKPALPPKWAFGPWMSSNNWDSQAEALKQAEMTKRHEIPATVFVLEQWSDEATFYIFNDAKYEPTDGKTALRYEDYEFPAWGRWPDPREMVRSLHADGLKVLLWQIPIVKHMYGVAHVQKDADEAAMLAAGYQVREADGSPYRIPYNWFKDSLVLDFTNEEANGWWFDKRRYLTGEIGIDGFKTDGGECVFGPDLRFTDGSTGAEMRNLYPNRYIGSYYAFVQEETRARGGGITFSRAGYAGAQNHPLHWAGDERSTYDAFRSSLHAGLSSGLSGIPFWGWDLSGFHGDIPTAELFVRSAQMAAFCPVMQYHAETKGEFNQDRTPWNIAERTGRPEVIGLYKKYADLRMNLLPYIYAEAICSAREGVPMMRPMFAAFPQDPSCRTHYGQYMFGASLLVAPVIEEGHFSKEVYFPEGRWLPLLADGGEIEGGCRATVRADLADIPVYLRENAVVPMNLNASLALGGSVGNRVDGYDRLVFCLYATSETAYTFEDDLGSAIRLSARKTDARIDLTLRSDRSEQPVVWLRGAGEADAIADEAGAYRSVASPEALEEGAYLLRNGETWLMPRRSAGTVSVRVSEGTLG
ncbi:glycoside hydrolase family 31 protein [Cohnella nanjingensis]|uniref:Glycoside hydrolase family 31 N-terminal domain-containing protein n=1 Tax=Cohnella nanjingensis TaxID=1387779 RepID=A0A7X0RW94_9BACL|nr:TIM-barrel domain-containing protein [Cohnella nanjingensis]MBB6673515.1 hypothetical protein [Cohnella nanjingensis]